jgi:hypothetical protein
MWWDFNLNEIYVICVYDYNFKVFFYFKATIHLISIENFLSADIRQVTSVRGWKWDQWQKSAIEIGCLYQP